MRILLFVSSLFLFFACNHNEEVDTSCIDHAAKKEGACAMIYLPVCGCDGKTYGNVCEASHAGVKHWKDGACE